MDMQLQSSKTAANQFQTWDYYVSGNIVPVLSDAGATNSMEDNQHATMAAFFQVGTIPQLPQFGVQWVEYFTREVSFGVVDGQIKSNLISSGLAKYYPSYDIVNEKLVVSVVSQ